jgi:hypothetical protein
MQQLVIDDWLPNEMHRRTVLFFESTSDFDGEHGNTTTFRYHVSPELSYTVTYSSSVSNVRGTKLRTLLLFQLSLAYHKNFIAAAFVHPHMKLIKICHMPYLGFLRYLQKIVTVTEDM